MYINRILVPLCALPFLSACNLGYEPTEGEILAQNFAAAVEDDGAYGETGVSALAQIDAMDGQRVSGVGDIPAGGSANYTGHMGVGTPEDGYIGDMSVSVTFTGDGSFDGQVTNFVDERGERVPGRLTISNGSVDMSVDPEEQWQIGASVNGQIDTGGRQEPFSASLNGEFLGSGAAHASGEVVSYDDAAGQTNVVGYFGVSR